MRSHTADSMPHPLTSQEGPQMSIYYPNYWCGSLMAMLAFSPSATQVQTEISQQPCIVLPQRLVQIFMLPKILLTLMIP